MTAVGVEGDAADAAAVLDHVLDRPVGPQPPHAAAHDVGEHERAVGLDGGSLDQTEALDESLHRQRSQARHS